jgi:hypothetical protein
MSTTTELRAMPILLLLLALLLPAPLRAQEPGPPNTVTVSATGVVQREPDRAKLLLSVESFAGTAQEAAARNAERMDALLAALRRVGLDPDDIRTVSYSLDPEYDFRQDAPRQPGEDRIIGYRARNTVEVTIDAIDRVGTIIDAAIQAGANRVLGISFELRDPDAARREAIAIAVGKARAEAEAVAAAVGRPLGPVLSVSTTGSFPVPVPMYRMDAVQAARAVATPIEPGTLEVAASITIVYALERR